MDPSAILASTVATLTTPATLQHDAPISNAAAPALVLAAIARSTILASPATLAVPPTPHDAWLINHAQNASLELITAATSKSNVALTIEATATGTPTNAALTNLNDPPANTITDAIPLAYYVTSARTNPALEVARKTA